MHPQVKKLLEIPKIEQKSLEWYKTRWNMVSASDYAMAIGRGKFGTARELIQKKVEPFVEHGPTTNPFFIWGILYEQVASDIYAKMHNVTVHEFGIIKHPKYEYLGASPDGITDDGIMLEFKCPLRRKIKPGDPVPEQYHMQVQGQLDVCGLELCDYFECELIECKNKSQFDFSIQTKGVFIKNTNGTYEYGPLILENQYTTEDKQTLAEYIKQNQNLDIKYWTLNVYNLVRVKYEKEFIEKTNEELRLVWDKILYYRENNDAYITEIVQSIKIDTELYNNKKEDDEPEVQFGGYAFIDEEVTTSSVVSKTRKTKTVSPGITKFVDQKLTGYAFIE